jgi:hypothetical protein
MAEFGDRERQMFAFQEEDMVNMRSGSRIMKLPQMLRTTSL